MEGGQRNFPTTNLTLVQRIRVPEYCVNALNEFFLQYWVPLYFFLREKGETHERASDILQGFIEREILEREQLASWDPSLGRLRTYLKVCLDRYRKNAIRSEVAVKRGGSEVEERFAKGLQWAESYYENQIGSGDPASYSDREWAAAIVNQTTQRLGESYVKKGKENEFRLLLQNLEARGGDSEAIAYVEIAEQLGISVESVKQRMRIFRVRFRQYLRQVVSDLVGEDEIEDELQYLLSLL
ncbi:MAG: hypothetical protein CMO55_06490 [Verrucomicrobiales bacterium]|nr:hypothetical protein [Verrucomicrobiales bacterium]